MWKGYLESLLKEENKNQFEEEPAVEGPIEDITIDEVILFIFYLLTHCSKLKP